MIIYNKPKPLTHPEETNEMSSHSCELLRFKQRLEKYIRRNDQDSCLRRSCEPKTFELVVPESPEEVNQPRENKHPQHYLTKIVKVTNRKRFNPCKWITASLGQTKVMPKMSEEQEIRN